MRRLIRQDFDRAFEKVDLIAGPITASPAFKMGEMEGDPLAMYLVDLYTVSAEPGRHAGNVLAVRPIKVGLADWIATAGCRATRGEIPPRRADVRTATDWHKQRCTTLDEIIHHRDTEDTERNDD